MGLFTYYDVKYICCFK